MVIIGLGSDFWDCVYWLDVLSLGFCFLSGFSEWVDSVFPVLLACSTDVFMGDLLLALNEGEVREN